MSQIKSNIIPKYVTIVVLCSCVQLFAENNPFNLQDNLQKIDQDQDALLSELKKLSIKHKQKALEKNTILSPIENKSNERAEFFKLREKQIEVNKNRAKLLVEQEKLKKDLEERESQKVKEALERREVKVYEAERLAKKEKFLLKRKKDTAIVHINITKEEHIKKQNADQEYLQAVAAVK